MTHDWTTKRIKVVLLVVAAVFAALVAANWTALDRIIRTDDCLDSGGRMGTSGVCEHGPVEPS